MLGGTGYSTAHFSILRFPAVVIPGYKRKPAYFKADFLKFMMLDLAGGLDYVSFLFSIHVSVDSNWSI